MTPPQIVSRLRPDLIDRKTKDVVFQACPFVSGNFLKRSIGLEDPIQARGFVSEHASPTENLDLYAEFEHVRRRGHDDIPEVGTSQHAFGSARDPSLDRHLIDRA